MVFIFLKVELDNFRTLFWVIEITKTLNFRKKSYNNGNVGAKIYIREGNSPEQQLKFLIYFLVSINNVLYYDY